MTFGSEGRKRRPVHRDMDFAEGMVSFRTLCGAQSSPVRFACDRALECVLLSRQAKRETLCF